MSSTVAVTPLAVTRMENLENKTTVPITLTPSNDQDVKPPAALARSRKRAASSEASHEDIKKQRGRPRVEPRDETAADRRRTQIRLAQRTYRARKESTISSLEDRVMHLENIIKDRNHGVHDLFQLAVTANLHHLHPPFFDALSKLNQSANTSFAGHAGEPSSAAFAPPPHGFVTDYSSSSGSDRQHISPPPPAHLSHESSFEETLPTVSNAMATSALAPSAIVDTVPGVHAVRPMQPGWGFDFYYEGQDEAPPSGVPYAYPAYSDQLASPATFGPIQQQQYPTQQVPPQHMPGSFAPPPPRIAMKMEPPLPQSYAFHESSFSRYFHRKCLEYALTILSEPVRYEPTIRKVFANTLKHATIDAVQKRMRSRLKNNADDDLNAPIDYEAPPDVDVQGRWLKPTEIEEILTERGLVINLRHQTADCVTEDESILPGALNPESLRNPHGAQRTNRGQIMVADPASYGSMPGFYGQTPLPPQDGRSGMMWNQQYPNPAPWPPGCKRRRLTVHLDSLMQFLVQASCCRGRTPAVRQQDVEAAFSRSVINVVPAC